MPTINVLSKNKKNITFCHLIIAIFTAMKYHSILHGHVCVMESQNFEFQQGSLSKDSSSTFLVNADA